MKIFNPYATSDIFNPSLDIEDISLSGDTTNDLLSNEEDNS